MTKEFTMDVYHTVKRIHNDTDQQALVAQAAKTIGMQAATDSARLRHAAMARSIAAESVGGIED